MKATAMQCDATARESRSELPSAASELMAPPEQIEAFRRLAERQDDDDKHDRHESDEDAAASQDPMSLVDFTPDAAPVSETPPPAPSHPAAFQGPAMNAQESFAETRRYERAGEEGDKKDKDSSDTVAGTDNSSAPDAMVFAHYVHQDAHAQAEAAATARSVRVERHTAVAELVQVLESSAATLLTPEDGARHDRVDVMLSTPHLEGTTVALFLENGRLVVEFAASGAAAKWLGSQVRTMSDELSARLRRPVLTRIHADGEETPEAEAVAARTVSAPDTRRVVAASRALS